MSGRIVSGERELSSEQLMERVARAASGFDGMGIGTGDAVCILLRNDFAFIEAAMAANLLGAYAVPINWHFKADEAGYIARDCGAKAIVAHADLLPQVEEGLPDGLHTFVVGVPPELRTAYGVSEEDAQPRPTDASWNDWLAQQTPRDFGAPTSPSSMIYTSGTTGRPKGVRREPPTEESAEAMAEMVALVFDLRPGAPFRTVITGPMYHSAPNAYGMYAARTDGLCLLQPRFDPEGLLALIERHKITHLHMVPTMFVRLLKLPEQAKQRYDLSSLQFVVHAAAPCPPEVKKQMIEWWGPVINEYYGATETGAVVFCDSEDALAKPGTVGKALPHAMLRVYDEQAKELGPGEIGEIYVRLTSLPDFTYHGQDQRRAEVERDGLITCGDVGYLDEDGFLFLCDRKRDMVISGGVNIYPAEIEATLVSMPGVRDCAVFGIPDDEFGESLCAYVESEEKGSLSAGQVKDYLGLKLARYKVPRVVEFSDQLPREDSGKIFKRKLREPYWEKAGRQI